MINIVTFSICIKLKMMIEYFSANICHFPLNKEVGRLNIGKMEGANNSIGKRRNKYI